MRTLIIRPAHGGYTLESIVAETLLVDTWIFKSDEMADMLKKIEEVLAIPPKKMEDWVEEIIGKKPEDSGRGN